MWKPHARVGLIIILFTGALIEILQFLYACNDYETLSLERKLSINLGQGQCQSTHNMPLDVGSESFGTLLASYPGSGMRLVWQHTEALTGVEVSNDIGSAEVTGIIKTQYPHQEGRWSYGDNMDQVILVIRNPRWALPSYHGLLYEINYALDFETAYKYYDRVSTIREPLAAWIKWRDYMFQQEIELWGKFIDFWMMGGKQYWMDFDYERNGRWPFEYLDEEDKKIDVHCEYEMDCYPRAVVSYERLRNPETGPDEADKIADLLDGKLSMNVLDIEDKPCVWEKTMTQPDDTPNNDSSDTTTTNHRAYYPFTYQQLLQIENKLKEYKLKYSGDGWARKPLSQNIVSIMDEYLLDIHDEIEHMEADATPTPAPNEIYQEQLLEWYKSVGRDSRYNKNKLKGMAIYEQIKPFYEDTDDGFHIHNRLRNRNYIGQTAE